jgi:aspartate racemase
MGTLGIVGGIAPESTVDYYRRFIAAWRARRADGSNPHILINSIDVRRVLALAGSNRLEELTDYMVEAVAALASAGARAALFASNTPHLAFDAVQARSDIPLISIVEAACAEAKARGLRRAGILGTRSTMQAAFYPGVFAKQGIAVVAPAEPEQEFVHGRYVGELVEGVFLPETRDRVLAIIGNMVSRDGLDAVVLAGTELPLLIRADMAHGVPLLDTTGIHVAAALPYLFGEDAPA